MASLSLSMMVILNVMFIFILVSVGYARPLVASPGDKSTSTGIQKLKVVDDRSNIKNSEASDGSSFDFPFPQEPFQSPIPSFPFPKIPDFPFPNLPPFNIPGIPTIPFPALPPV
ncbi:hypothetical protein L1887_08539 [Cichorium endivia]|nr:hypothetical protein L1887_08539 [Cichorium endivia]